VLCSPFSLHPPVPVPVPNACRYKGLANKSKYRENQMALQEVSRKLRDSTKNLCRNLKENPNVGGNLIKIQQERTDIEELFQDSFEEMEASATFTRLRKTVDADRQDEKDVANLIKREKQLAVDVKNLEEELEAVKVEYVRDVRERKQQISTLKKTLRTLQTTTKIRQQCVPRSRFACRVLVACVHARMA
jgi:hypothetical protein